MHGLTETGMFHIRRLQLNRPAPVAHRLEQRLLEADRAAYRVVVTRLADLEQQLSALQAELEALQTPPPADQS